MFCMIHAELQFVNPQNAKIEENFRKHTIIWEKLHFALQSGGLFQRILKVKEKVKKGVDKFPLR